jgi:chitin synthase
MLFGIDKYDYMFFTDADSFIKVDSLTQLIDGLEYRNVTAACGLVMVDFEGHCGVFWNILQNFQYLYRQYIRRNVDNIIAKVSCLPGCIIMVKVDSRLVNVITDYGTMPLETDLILTTVQRLGTDRCRAHLFLFHQLKTCMVDSAVCYTKPPQSWYRLLTHERRERRRWGSNAFFNTSRNVWFMKIHPLIRISAFFDLMKMSLVVFRLFNIGLFISQVIAGANVLNMIKQSAFVYYPPICFLSSRFVKKEFELCCTRCLRDTSLILYSLVSYLLA